MKWFNFVNKAPGIFDIFIYGAIVEPGWKWDATDITPLDFKNELDKTEGATTLNLYINSPGGHISAGLAIYNMLKRHPANKVARVDGISASIANVISMAADKIVMPKTSLMLAHKPLLGICGMFNADDLLTLAAELDTFEVPIVAAYAAKTGLSDKEIRKILEKDAFMDAEEAVELGFADEIGEEKPLEASISEDVLTLNGVKIDLKSFKNFPTDRFKTAPAPEKPAENAQKSTPEPQKVADFSVLEAEIVHNSNFTR